MAETYGVYDWRQLPLITAATLVQGLPIESRVMKAIAGNKGPDADTLLLAIIADRVGHIAWMLSADGSKGRNHPPSILAALTKTEGKTSGIGFDSADDFHAAWAAIGGDADA